MAAVSRRMLERLAWLTLEVRDLDRSRQFYRETLGLTELARTDSSIAFDVGDSALVIRRPTSVPRGGLHTHFAFSIPSGRFDHWWERLEPEYDLTEHDFNGARSLYLDDPDGHCVELGERPESTADLDDIFEIVLEVEALDQAVSFYRRLGFDEVSRDTDRPRRRLAGPIELELWEPHLGIADARGGVHVDIGFETPKRDAVVDAISDRACEIKRLEERTRIRDPDGHWVTVL